MNNEQEKKHVPVFMSSDNKNAVRQTTNFILYMKRIFRVQYEYYE